MDKQLITFRLDAKKKLELDALAEKLERDRSYLINAAIESYIETHRWQLAHIRRGLRQAENKDFASAREVQAALKKLQQ